MRVYYRNMICVKYERTVVFTWDAAFAILGGIFCLCTGGSIISIFQIVYYLTFRLFVVDVEPKSTADVVRKFKQRSQVADWRFAMEYGRRLQQFRGVTAKQ